ncbi:MAG TPA: hypothetical protein VEW68_07820 [Patescibacteria group bacterium]|nr:hypothetical protein [Patescibacteria group bacterium]
MEIRQAVLWAVLLATGQALDVLTTMQDSARGTLEAMPISAGLLDRGGIALFYGVKLLLVAAAGIALVLTARWIKSGTSGSRTVFRIALVGVQAATIGLAAASLSNVILLGSVIR